MGEVHYPDVNGNLQNIDVMLHDEAELDLVDFPIAADGKDLFDYKLDIIKKVRAVNNVDREKCSFQALKLPFALKLPRNWQKGYTVGRGTARLKFTPLGASSSMGWLDEKTKDSLHYQDAWNDTDVCLQVTTNGLKETITLKTDRAPSSFSFEVTGVLANDLTAGTIKIQPAWLIDSKGAKRDVPQTLRREANGVFLDVVADVTGLTFPVVIDPTLALSPTNSGWDAYIAQSASSVYPPNTAVTINTTGNILVENSFYTAGSLYYWEIGVIKFDTTSIPTGAVVQSASLAVYLSGGISNANGLSLKLDWYSSNNTADFTTADFTAPSNVTGTAGSFALSSLVNAVTNTLTLSSPASNVVKGGYTAFRASVPDGATPTGVNVLTIYSTDQSTNKPVLSVIYNTAPTSPTLTSPNGGETWNASQTITWTAATDTDTAQSALQYNIDVSTDSGTTWTQVVALTAAGVTSYIYDFTSIAQSSTCLIRIRAYDGTGYGPYDQSNGVFTIQHNTAPTAPTLLAPDSGSPKDRAQVIRLSWQHNDPQSDPQAKFDLMYSTDAGVTWTTVTQTTVNQYYDVPASTFIHGNVLWKVRTYDPSGLSGPYSAQAIFLAGDKPATATITAPTSSVGVARPTVQWSSIGQVDYQVQVLTTLSAVFWDSGDVVSINTAVTVGVDLANTTNYTIQARIKNVDGLWSDWTTLAISVSYTPPPISGLTVSTVQDYLSLAWTTPAPTGSQPTVSYYRVYKKGNSTATFTLYKDNVSTSSFLDYQVGNGVQYQYAIGTVGANGTESISPSVYGTAQFSNLYITDPATGTSIQLYGNLEYDNASLDRVRTSLQPLSGSYPTVVYGSRMARKGVVKATIVPADGQTPLVAYKLFETLVNGTIKIPLTMKKSNGEIFIVDIFNLQEKEERLSKYKNCTFEFEEVAALPWS